MSKPDLTLIFADAARALSHDDRACEVLARYRHEWVCGRMSVAKFRGFLEGLFVGRVLPADVFEDLDRAVCAAEQAN